MYRPFKLASLLLPLWLINIDRPLDYASLVRSFLSLRGRPQPRRGGKRRPLPRGVEVTEAARGGGARAAEGDLLCHAVPHATRHAACRATRRAAHGEGS